MVLMKKNYSLKAPKLQIFKKQFSSQVELWRDNSSIQSSSLGSNGSSSSRSQEQSQRNIQDYYKIYQSIGYGQLGELRAAKSKSTGEYVAVKQILKYKFKHNLYCSAQKEYAIMKRLQGHPNIVKLLDTFEDRNSLYIVMELCKEGDLFDKVMKKRQYSQLTAAQIIQEVLKSVQFCHQKGIVHRDIQFESFQITGKQEGMKLKLINFGLAEPLKLDELLSEEVGQLQYRAPEVLKKCYDHRADIWSCGVMLYVLLCGRLPFQGDSKFEIRENILNQDLDFEREPWPQVSLQAKDMLQIMLNKNPNYRPSIYQLLNHDFLRHAEQLSNGCYDEIVYDRLMFFLNQNKLKRQAMHIISKTMSAAQLRQLQQYFNFLDQDEDGEISIEDLQSVFQHRGKFELDSQRLRDIIKCLDTNKDGKINYYEFIAATMNPKLNIYESKVQNVFKIFDKDHKGYLNQEDILGATDCYRNDRQGDLQQVLEDADKNKNGRIEYSEFAKMMLQNEDDSMSIKVSKIQW